MSSPRRSRDRVIAAVFVVAAIAAQSYWLGHGVILLSLGLIITYLVWALTPWKNEPARVLPTYLLAIVVQCVHFTEEFITGFQRQFPKVLGSSEWTDAQFVTFNMAWLAVFVLAVLGVYRRMQLAYLVVLFLALIGGVGNGTSHLLLAATHGGYFPGLVTAPLCLLVGIAVLGRLFGQTREHVK